MAIYVSPDDFNGRECLSEKVWLLNHYFTVSPGIVCYLFYVFL
ncbi:amino acid permease [Neisseria wadsworthii 9715]|uniref:Amino acid permease n=1 Tax=Neisseria wadsworthii 9715 TaxID=1030841 RepID=G4CTS8_9NEIS|nr:amino acid permease [Neisseria wadsworthii 9715]